MVSSLSRCFPVILGIIIISLSSFSNAYSHDIDFRVVPPKKIYPKYTPSLSNGKQVFEKHCIKCHNKEAIPGSSANFWDSEEMRLIYTPFYYFFVSSVGRREMPVFDFTEEEHWDVVFYTKSLSINEKNITSGEKKYEEICAACHGTGGFDGHAKIDLSSQQWSARKTDDEIYTYIVNNYRRKKGHYVKENLLTMTKDADIWSIVDYLRSLQYTK